MNAIRSLATACLLLLSTSLPSATAQVSLAPGPCLEKRKEVVNYLDKARKAGIGVKPYEEALQRIEDNVKAGQPEDEIKKQVFSLCGALAQQVNNLKVLKVSSTYRAVSGPSSTGSSSSAGASNADTTGGGKRNPGGGVSEAAMESLLLDLVNQHRKEAGLGAVSANSALAQVAKEHARDMGKRKFFDHVNPDGLDHTRRAAAAGLSPAVLENIGYVSPRSNGLDMARAADASLMRSPGHKANILDARMGSCGIGVAYDATGGIEVCQMFTP